MSGNQLQHTSQKTCFNDVYDDYKEEKTNFGFNALKPLYKENLCNRMKKVRDSAKILENVLDISSTIVKIMMICGIHECKASKAMDVIIYAFMHFDEVAEFPGAKCKKKIRKEEFYNDLMRDCDMIKSEAKLTYSIVKCAFKAFYHKQVVTNYDIDMVDECEWRNAANRTITAFAESGATKSESELVGQRIQGAYESYIRRMQMKKAKKVCPQEIKDSCTCYKSIMEKNQTESNTTYETEQSRTNLAAELVCQPVSVPCSRTLQIKCKDGFGRTFLKIDGNKINFDPIVMECEARRAIRHLKLNEKEELILKRRHLDKITEEIEQSSKINEQIEQKIKEEKYSSSAIKSEQKPEKEATPTRVESRTPLKVESKIPLKVESKIPLKVESETPLKVESETPLKVESKTPLKVESKTPLKVESKTPLKVESKTPLTVESKTPLKVESKTPLKVEAQDMNEGKEVKAEGSTGTFEAIGNIPKIKMPTFSKSIIYVTFHEDDTGGLIEIIMIGDLYTGHFIPKNLRTIALKINNDQPFKYQICSGGQIDAAANPPSVLPQDIMEQDTSGNHEVSVNFYQDPNGGGMQVFLQGNMYNSEVIPKNVKSIAIKIINDAFFKFNVCTPEDFEKAEKKRQQRQQESET